MSYSLHTGKTKNKQKQLEYKLEEGSNLILFLTLTPAPQNGQ